MVMFFQCGELTFKVICCRFVFTGFAGSNIENYCSGALHAKCKQMDNGEPAHTGDDQLVGMYLCLTGTGYDEIFSRSQ